MYKLYWMQSKSDRMAVSHHTSPGPSDIDHKHVIPESVLQGALRLSDACFGPASAWKKKDRTIGRRPIGQ